MWTSAVRNAYRKNKPLDDLDTIGMFLAEVESLPIPRTEKTKREILKYIAQHSEMDLKHIWERDALDLDLPNKNGFGKFIFPFENYERRMKILEEENENASGLDTVTKDLTYFTRFSQTLKGLLSKQK